jgi:hypothetical protein
MGWLELPMPWTMGTGRVSAASCECVIGICAKRGEVRRRAAIRDLMVVMIFTPGAKALFPAGSIREPSLKAWHT